MMYSPTQYAIALHELSQEQSKKEQEKTFSVLKDQLSQPLIKKVFVELSKLQKNQESENTIIVTTPEKVSKSEQEKIKKMFGKYNYEFRQDKSLIAGIIVQKNNKIFYDSIKTTISNLKKELVKK